MSIRLPSSALSKPSFETLNEGSQLHRVHRSSYAAREFNPCAGQVTRFAPVRDFKGACVPSLYAGSSLDAAIYETIFHDIPITAQLKTVPRQMVLLRSHSVLELLRPLRVVPLRGPELRKWRIGRNQLLTSSAKLYEQTALWAEAIHHQFPEAEGLVWTSNLCDPDSAYLFFGDRVTPNDFSVLVTRDGGNDRSFLGDVRKAGRRGGITIVL